MKAIPRIVEAINNLRTHRVSQLTSIFSKISYRNKYINIYSLSIGGNIVFGISDGKEAGKNFKDWRFQTISNNITGGYFEVWINLGKDKYFLERSYFHLYTIIKAEVTESEYVLLHCDASEPDNTPHYQYKQSPHLHIKAAEPPLPKAHLALYNGRVNQILKNLASFDAALKETIEMIESQILSEHPLHYKE